VPQVAAVVNRCNVTSAYIYSLTIIMITHIFSYFFFSTVHSTEETATL
jgi:hypothetical protein